ncbi:MAG: SOS response-associated peptidase, partial [Alphaproteobacteria bacterium]|nr:SOS response-associated peptidase [Alphaproteobacteria bacterium]
PAKPGPIAFAGLWETWTGPNGEEMETAAIITTQANKTLARVHHRAPVIVSPEAFDLWLDCAKFDTATAAALIVPAPESAMALREISPAVNSVANDSPDLLDPYTEPQPPAEAPKARAAARPKRDVDTGQGSLF